jgi:hypothetical protein
MFGIESEPLVCMVTGHQIRALIDKHVVEGQRALESYQLALRDGVAGVDWTCAIDLLQERIKLAILARPAIGEGPFPMSVAQWIALANRWPPVFDATAVVTENERRKIHQASHETTSGRSS